MANIYQALSMYVLLRSLHLLLELTISKSQWIKQQGFVSCSPQSEVSHVDPQSSSFLTLLSWSLSLSASQTGTREVWKMHGRLRVKAGISVLYFVHIPLARIQSRDSSWGLGSGVKLCAQALSQLQCAVHLVNPHKNPLNGFIIFFFSQMRK